MSTSYSYDFHDINNELHQLQLHINDISATQYQYNHPNHTPTSNKTYDKHRLKHSHSSKPASSLQHIHHLHQQLESIELEWEEEKKTNELSTDLDLSTLSNRQVTYELTNRIPKTIDIDVSTITIYHSPDTTTETAREAKSESESESDLTLYNDEEERTYGNQTDNVTPTKPILHTNEDGDGVKTHDLSASVSIPSNSASQSERKIFGESSSLMQSSASTLSNTNTSGSLFDGFSWGVKANSDASSSSSLSSTSHFNDTSTQNNLSIFAAAKPLNQRVIKPSASPAPNDSDDDDDDFDVDDISGEDEEKEEHVTSSNREKGAALFGVSFSYRTTGPRSTALKFTANGNSQVPASSIDTFIMDTNVLDEASETDTGSETEESDTRKAAIESGKDNVPTITSSQRLTETTEHGPDINVASQRIHHDDAAAAAGILNQTQGSDTKPEKADEEGEIGGDAERDDDSEVIQPGPTPRKDAVSSSSSPSIDALDITSDVEAERSHHDEEEEEEVGDGGWCNVEGSFTTSASAPYEVESVKDTESLDVEQHQALDERSSSTSLSSASSASSYPAAELIDADDAARRHDVAGEGEKTGVSEESASQQSDIASGSSFAALAGQPSTVATLIKKHEQFIAQATPSVSQPSLSQPASSYTSAAPSVTHSNDNSPYQKAGHGQGHGHVASYQPVFGRSQLSFPSPSMKPFWHAVYSQPTSSTISSSSSLSSPITSNNSTTNTSSSSSSTVFGRSLHQTNSNMGGFAALANLAPGDGFRFGNNKPSDFTNAFGGNSSRTGSAFTTSLNLNLPPSATHAHAPVGSSTVREPEEFNEDDVDD